MNGFIANLLAWRPGGYMRASTGLFVWLLVRAAGQAAMVVALARLLGASGYGSFITTLAIATFFTPFAGLGVHGVLLRDGARNPEGLPKQLGAALDLWTRSTIVFGVAGIITVVLFLPRAESVPTLAALVLAEVASGSLVEILGRAEQSQHRPQRYGAMLAGLILARLFALLMYALIAHPTVTGWMWAYATSSVLYGGALLTWIKRAIKPQWPHTANWKLAQEGIPFALGATSMRLQAEFNKPVLAQLGYALAANFNTAQRAMDVATLPLAALQEALWPRLYTSNTPLHRMLLTSCFLITLALASGIALTLAAPLLPRLLGLGFEATAHLLQMLAWLPAVQVLRNLVNFYAIAQHRTHILTWAYLAGALASILLTSVLVTSSGMAGAVIAAYLIEVTVIGTQISMHLMHARDKS